MERKISYARRVKGKTSKQEEAKQERRRRIKERSLQPMKGGSKKGSKNTKNIKIVLKTKGVRWKGSNEGIRKLKQLRGRV